MLERDRRLLKPFRWLLKLFRRQLKPFRRLLKLFRWLLMAVRLQQKWGKGLQKGESSPFVCKTSLLPFALKEKPVRALPFASGSLFWRSLTYVLTGTTDSSILLEACTRSPLRVQAPHVPANREGCRSRKNSQRTFEVGSAMLWLSITPNSVPGLTTASLPLER